MEANTDRYLNMKKKKSNNNSNQTEVFRYYLNKISELFKNREYITGLKLAEEMKARLMAQEIADPFFLGWQRYYSFLFLYQMQEYQKALELFQTKEKFPYMLDLNQMLLMTSAAAEISSHVYDAELTLKLARLSWSMSFKLPDSVTRIKNAQNACIYLERLKQSRLNFCFARFLSGFGRKNNIAALYLQGLECLAANYNQSSSPSIADVLIQSQKELSEMIESTPPDIEKARIAQLISRVSTINNNIETSGEFENARLCVEKSIMSELSELLKLYKSLVYEYDENAVTLLMDAIRVNNKSAVALLIEKGADLHHCEIRQGLTPLLAAVNLGYTDIVKILIDNGSDLEVKAILGQTPLIRAVINGHVNTLALLIEHGALTDRKDQSGNTALMHAVEIGDLEVVKCLVYMGADIKLKNREGFSLVQIAKAAGNTKTLRFLKQIKAT